MTAVVTGAGGHLGGRVVEALLAAGQAVRAVDVRPLPGLAAAGAATAVADVLDPMALRSALAGADVVYHLAAVISIAGDPDGRVWATNVDGTANVCAAALAAGARRLVHCSSVHAFDAARSGPQIDESSPPAVDPTLPRYDRSKAFGERAVRRAVEAGLDAVIVNPTAIIGPPDPGPSRMGRVLRAAFGRRLSVAVAGGFDWVDVRDVAAGILAAAERGRTGEGYLLGNRYETVADLLSWAQRVSAPSNRTTRAVRIPARLVRAGAAAALRADQIRPRPGGPLFTPEALHALQTGKPVSHAKARAELGYSPRPLTRTLPELRAYFQGGPGA